MGSGGGLYGVGEENTPGVNCILGMERLAEYSTCSSMIEWGVWGLG